MRTIYNYPYAVESQWAEINNSSQIREVQQFLISKGYNLGRWGADGKRGRYTNQAIYDYIKAQARGGGSTQPITPTIPNYSSIENEINKYKSIFSRKGYIFQNDELRLNIIGVRNLDANADYFDDELVVIWKENGQNQIKAYAITTDPGKGYLGNRMLNPKGTAILKPGQYRNAYKLGYHRGQYTALVQRSGPVTVYRDNNRNGSLDFMIGNQDTGYFGINIHKAGVNSTNVNRWSAGCQVFKREADFNEFIALCRRSEGRHGSGTKFTYTLLEERGDNIV